MEKNKVVIIILVISFSFVVGGGCYYFFRLSGKSKKVNISESDKNEKVDVSEDVYEIARNDVSLLFQEIDDYEQKIVDERAFDQEDIDKNVRILKVQGIWDGFDFESDYEDYLYAVQSSKDDAKFKINKLLEKVKKKEKSLESFREELEKIGEEIKKNIDENAETFDEIAERIQKEAEKPMPFLATWIGIVVSVIICPIISYFILLSLQKYKWCEKKEEEGGGHIIDFIFTMLICLPLQSLIFPLLNCLLSLKMSCFREIYILFIALSFFILNFFFSSGECCQNQNNGDVGGKPPAPNPTT